MTGTVSFGDDGKLELRDREAEASIARQKRAYDEHYRRRSALAVARDAVIRRTIEVADATVAPLPQSARLADLRDTLCEDELFLEFVFLGQTDATGRLLGRNRAVACLKSPY